MNIMRLKRTILVCIMVLAGFVRLFHIGTNPPSISWDEASIGYNAYTILTSLRDEHGSFLPLATFAAFGDYKPPVPVYLTVPFVLLFGLTEVAVRLPSAVFGIASVYCIYLLIGELLRTEKKKRKTSDQVELAALSGALVMAVTPWHIMLSRAGFEANIATFFVTLGVLWMIRAMHDARYRLVAWIPFVVGIYTFNSARYAGPLIAGYVFVAGFPSVRRSWRNTLVGILIAGVLMVPIIPHLLSSQSRLRFQEVSIFTDLRTVLTSNARQVVDGSAWWSGIVHNRRIGYAHEYLVHFFDNLEPRFLFVRGDGNPKFSIQDTGQLLMSTAPFLVIGFLALFLEYPSVGWFLLFWLVASIIPAAVARETPHALRVENGLPVYMIAIGYGIASVVYAVRKANFRKVAWAGIVLLVLANFLYFWHTLTAHYPTEYSGEWQYGYKQAIELATEKYDQYDTIVLTESIGRPYIYALFYGKVPLMRFLETRDASFDAAGFYNVYGFGKYRFTKEGVGSYTGHVLYILPPKDVPATATIVEEIRLLNGTPELVAFE